MHGKDASGRGKATGNNQPVQIKDERVAQHECQHNNSNGDSAIADDDHTDNNDKDNYIGSGGQHQEIHHVLGKVVQQGTIITCWHFESA